jgi:drug/metabolite transporter (DMT)-like permease
MSKRWQAELLLFLNALIWGVTFLTVKNALADASPILFVALRFTLAGIVLVLLYVRKLDRRTLLPGTLAGFLLFAGYAFQTTGLRFTTASKSAFITGLAIPMVPLLSFIVYKRRPRPAELAGVLAATIGMALMTLQDTHLQVSPGDLLTALCAAAFAGHIVALGYFSNWATSKGLGFESLAVWQIVTAAIFAFVSFSWLDRSAGDAAHLNLGGRLWLALAITGLLATAFAFTVQTWAQQYTTPTRTALIYSLEPVFAWGFSWIVAGETLSRRATLGALLILAGILLVEVKRSDDAQHPIVSVTTPEV